MGLVYLPTSTPKTTQMWGNVSYIEHLGMFKTCPSNFFLFGRWSFSSTRAFFYFKDEQNTFPPWNKRFAPENGWLEYYIVSFWDFPYFHGRLLVSGRVNCCFDWNLKRYSGLKVLQDDFSSCSSCHRWCCCFFRGAFCCNLSKADEKRI